MVLRFLIQNCSGSFMGLIAKSHINLCTRMFFEPPFSVLFIGGCDSALDENIRKSRTRILLFKKKNVYKKVKEA